MAKSSPFEVEVCECGGAAAFLDYEVCSDCLGVDFVDYDEAVEIVARWRQEVEDELRAVIEGRLHPTDVLGPLLLADALDERERTDLVVLEDRPWALLDLLARWPATADTKVPYSGALIKRATQAVDLATLRRLQYELPSGQTALVRRVQDSTHEFPTFGFGPEIPLRLREGRWTDATRLPFGQVPAGVQGDEQIEAWFVEDDPNGSFAALLKDHDLSMAPLFSSFQRQFYKVWMEGLIPRLANMKSGRLMDLARLVAAIEELGVETFLPDDKERNMPFLEVDASQLLANCASLDHPDVLGDVLVGSGQAPPMPLVACNQLKYGVPKNLLRHYKLVLGGYRTGLDRRRHIDYAGDSFEQLVGRVLERQGCGVGDGPPLVNVSRAKNHDPDEIDVIIMHDDRVLLIECKAKIDAPGAWTPSGIEARAHELQGELRKLRGKRDRWEDHLRAGLPVRQDKTGLSLPVDRDAVRVDAAMVSIRMEPGFDAEFSFCTMWPQAAAERAAPWFANHCQPLVGHLDLAGFFLK